MVAPRCRYWGREEYKRGFGVPTLIAVHPENDPKGEKVGISLQSLGCWYRWSHAGCLRVFFRCWEVKSDLMGEQTILCGMLQAGSIVSYEKMVADSIDPSYAGKLLQYGWGNVHFWSLRIWWRNSHDGRTVYLAAKIKAFELSEELKDPNASAL